MRRAPDLASTLPEALDEDGVEPRAPLVQAGGAAVPDPRAPPRSEHLHPQDPFEDGPRGLVGQVFGNRYRLVKFLARGAHGEVWTAHDRMLSERVALKWVHGTSRAIQARVRREIAILRMLRVPGVVRFIDEGVEGGDPFIVMKRVRGRPFPGVAPKGRRGRRRSRWQDISGVVFSLLEILSRIHAAGVIHRDLKPSNVLVSADAQVTVLDFGISLPGETTGAELTAMHQVLGTPGYLAPEQSLGAAAGARVAVDARTDLYSVGVMLYEALAGQPPHEASGSGSLYDMRRFEPAPRLRDVAPDVPRGVAEVIDRLVRVHAGDRFGSAAEALAALRGEAPAVKTVLPWLGGDRSVDVIVQAVMEGRCIDVVGPQGSGRTRCLEEAEQRLKEGGYKVVRTDAARSPFMSLMSLICDMQPGSSSRLTAVASEVERRVREALRSGVVVLVDGVEDMDQASLEVLNRCRKDEGVIVRTLSTAPKGPRRGALIVLEPLDESALRPLFAGPDRLFHLQEDAARALWERTGGLPARIEAEVASWVGLRLARRDGARLLVGRGALARLSAGLLGVLPASSAPASIVREPHLVEILRWLALGGHSMDVRQLAAAMDEPVWRVEWGCKELVRCGAAQWSGDLRIVPRAQMDIPWNDERRAEAHRRIAGALRPGQEGRLFHLIAVDLVRQSVSEAITLGRRRAMEGDHAGAAVALEEGLRVVRQQEGAAWLVEEARLLEELVKAAFAEETPPTMGRALYEIVRSKGRGADVKRLESLVRAVMAVSGAMSLHTLDRLGKIAPFTDPELERRRQRARVRAVSARLSCAGLQAVLADIEAWAQKGGRLAELTLLEGRGVLCYLEGHFKEAAELYAEAAKLEPGLSGRIATTLKSASALLEAFELEAAGGRAEEARVMARRCRNPYWEARAEWLVRAALYRRGQDIEPDLELVEAVGRVGVEDLEALMTLTEAAVAFRSGALSAAVKLAEKAADIYRRLERSEAETLARCLAIACGATVKKRELGALARTAMKCDIPGIGIQALGLLGRRFPEERRRWRHAPPLLWERVPREHWRQRMDVLSIEESLVWAFGGAPLPSPSRRGQR